MFKKLFIISMLLSLFTNNIFGQTLDVASTQEIPPPHPVNTITNVVEQMNRIDMNRLLLYFVFIVIVVVAGLYLLHKVFSYIIDKIEDLKIGSFTLKLKKNKIEQTHKIDFYTILNVFEFVMRSELKVVINDTVSSVNDIHTIELDYDKNADNTFNKTFSTIERDLHDKLVALACEVTGFDLIKIKNTREYFFISDLLYDYKKIWTDDVKEITRRNGFVEFLNDRTRAEPYINELANAINQCIDMGKLESTDLPKKKIDEIIKSSYKDYHSILDNMFYSLAISKSKMLTKRNDKLQHIENNIDESSNRIINEIRSSMVNRLSGENLDESNKKEEKK